MELRVANAVPSNNPVLQNLTKFRRSFIQIRRYTGPTRVRMEPLSSTCSLELQFKRVTLYWRRNIYNLTDVISRHAFPLFIVTTCHLQPGKPRNWGLGMFLFVPALELIQPPTQRVSGDIFPGIRRSEPEVKKIGSCTSTPRVS